MFVLLQRLCQVYVVLLVVEFVWRTFECVKSDDGHVTDYEQTAIPAGAFGEVI